jgi:hypothetical protein
MKMVVLKTGNEEPNLLVVATFMNLEDLQADDPGALWELVEACRKPEYKVLNPAPIEATGLMSAGKVRDSIKNIVLASVEGEMLDMHLVNPIGSQGA